MIVANRYAKSLLQLAVEKGPCPDAIDAGLMERFTHKTAIAPTASISIIAGNSSPGIEPYNANTFTQKTFSNVALNTVRFKMKRASDCA